MAKLSKKELDKLWKKFKDNPKNLTINEYKSISDSAITLYQSGEISEDEARKMMSAVSKYYNG